MPRGSRSSLSSYHARSNSAITASCGSYYWPTTWDFVDDLYTYDVLTWIERLTYHFRLPPEYTIRSVTTGAIDLFGHEWARNDRVTNQDNEFVCVTKHLPPFTSWRVRYSAERIDAT